jgi:hypothetical protein
VSPNLTELILKRNPEWFAPNFNIECGDGWFDIIAELLDKLIVLSGAEPEDFLDFSVTQIKEKFGGLRFYYAIGPDCSHRRIQTLVEGAERRSLTVCELCGKEANVRTIGYIMTLCRYPHNDPDE